MAMVDYEAVLGSTSTPTWMSIANKNIQRGNAEAAMETAEQAHDDYRNKGDKKGEGAALLMMASAALEAGSFDVSMRMSSEALSNFQVTKNTIGESAALVVVSTAYYCSGQYQEAIARAEDAARMAQKCDATKQMAYGKKAVATAALAMLHAQQNEDSEIAMKALEAAQAASNTFRGSDDKAEVGELLSLLSQAFLFTGNCNMALAKAKMAQRIYQAELDTPSEARTLLIVAMALHKEGSSDAAMQQLEDAANLFKSIEDQNGQEAAYGLMEEYQSLAVQERDNFTQRVVQRFDKGEKTGAEAHSFSAKRPASFMPPQQPTTHGPAVVKFIGLMGRSASAAPKKSSSGAAAQNKSSSLYNVTWEVA